MQKTTFGCIQAYRITIMHLFNICEDYPRKWTSIIGLLTAFTAKLKAKKKMLLGHEVNWLVFVSTNFTNKTKNV